MHEPAPRRILMSVDTVGGVWTYALELAGALAPTEVILAAMGRLPSPVQRAEAAAVPNVELRAEAYRLEWMPEPWDDVARAGAWLLGLEDELAPDVVHLNGFAHGALPWRKPTVVVAHSCVLSWHRAVRGCEAPKGWDRYRAAVRRGLGSAGTVVAPSHAMLDSLKRDYGPFAHSTAIWNGRDPASFAAMSKEPFVLGVGRLWDEAKNVDALAGAAAGLAWPVVVAGDLGDAQRPRNVLSLGHRGLAEIAALMARASIFASPARYEPFGLAPLEAALAGCARVLGDVPSLREVWGDAALFVPPDDRAALHATLQRLIANPFERHRRAAAARARAARYTPGRMARAYLDVYRKLREVVACA
jgi:glycogen synthase